MGFLSMFKSFKFWVALGLAVGIGIAAWYAIRTWRNDIRTMVFNELFADLVEQKNKENSDTIKSLQEQLKDLNDSLEEERIARKAIDDRTNALLRRTIGKEDGKPSPILRETMLGIYESQGK